MTQVTQTQQQASSPIDQFLTPESMLTPGIAGATAMMITNALGNNFDMSLRWTALILSFVFGLLSIMTNRSLPVKLLFYVLNSLVIFCVASGANTIGQKVQVKTSIISTAYAQKAMSEQDAKACTEIYSQIASKLAQIDEIKSTGNDGTAKMLQLYADYTKLRQQGQAIEGCAASGGSDSVLHNPQPLGGPNSITRNPGGFFKQW
jgi:hypothetical protein